MTKFSLDISHRKHVTFRNAPLLFSCISDCLPRKLFCVQMKIINYMGYWNIYRQIVGKIQLTMNYGYCIFFFQRRDGNVSRWRLPIGYKGMCFTNSVLQEQTMAVSVSPCIQCTQACIELCTVRYRSIKSTVYWPPPPLILKQKPCWSYRSTATMDLHMVRRFHWAQKYFFPWGNPKPKMVEEITITQPFFFVAAWMY